MVVLDTRCNPAIDLTRPQDLEPSASRAPANPLSYLTVAVGLFAAGCGAEKAKVDDPRPAVVDSGVSGKGTAGSDSRIAPVKYEVAWEQERPPQDIASEYLNRVNIALNAALEADPERKAKLNSFGNVTLVLTKDVVASYKQVLTEAGSKPDPRLAGLDAFTVIFEGDQVNEFNAQVFLDASLCAQLGKLIVSIDHELNHCALNGPVLKTGQKKPYATVPAEEIAVYNKSQETLRKVENYLLKKVEGKEAEFPITSAAANSLGKLREAELAKGESFLKYK